MSGHKFSALMFVVFSGCLPAITYADYALHMYLGDFGHSGAAKTTSQDNASAAFNNPAALPALADQQLSFDAQYFMSSASFTNQGSTDAISQPLTGSNGGDPGSNTLVPGLYYSYRLSDRFGLGLTINAPFGLETEWDSSTWVGRYQSVKTGIQTLNINPALGYKIDETWSIGGGISFQEAKAELSSAIDFGAVCFALLDPTTCAGIGLPAPQAADGFLKLEGEDTGIGYHLGLLYQTAKTRIGVTYRSQINYTLEGDADFTTPAQAAAFAPAFTDTQGSVDLTLPEVASIGIAHHPSDQWAVFADATWTRWSRIKEYHIRFANPAQPDQILPRNWKDTWRLAVGADYKLNPQWMLQGGLAYAQSAIPDETFDPSIPTSDAYWLNLGTKYQASNSVTLSFGIAHIFFDARTINYTGSYSETVRGTVDPELNVLNARLDLKL